MNIDIKTTNIELTPAIENYVSEKIGGLEKYIKNRGKNTNARVEVGKTTMHHRTGDFFRAEIQISVLDEGENFRTEATKDDLYAAIDEAQNEMKLEMAKTKERKISFLRRGSRMAKNFFSKFPPFRK